MRYKTFLFVCILVLGSSFACASGAGTITATKGRVDMVSPGEEIAFPVTKGDRLPEGAIVRTKSLSKAEITFDDGTVTRLAENSRLWVKIYRFDETDTREAAHLNLQRGEVSSIVSDGGQAKGTLIVSTPNAVAEITGTDVTIFYKRSETGVLVEEGRITLSHNDFPYADN